jgi:myo-inositol-1(or 4)-monophosphatase
MDHYRKIAIKAARQAGDLIKERLGHVKNLDYKGKFNIVTDVDRDAEAKIVGILRSEFPDHEILAEEGGLSKGRSSSKRWLIDPLDGTTNFAHSYPFFCISIALEADGEVVLGVVFNPISEELFWAQTGEGAWLNDEPIHVSRIDSLSESLLATGFPPDSATAKDNNLLQFATLTNMCQGVRRDGAAALDLCFVACGRLDGFWERKLAPWDMGAGIIIISEAGGKVTDPANGPLDISKGHIVATNGLVHDSLVQVLQELSRKEELKVPK